MVICTFFSFGWLKQVASSSYICLMDKKLVVNIYPMTFSRNFGASLNTVEEDYWTVKWWCWNKILNVQNLVICDFSPFGWLKQVAGYSYIYLMDKQLVVNIYPMNFSSKFCAYLSTVEEDFWTVKWWCWNIIHSVQITFGIFIIDYIINILDDREKTFPVIGKTCQTHLKNRIENNYVLKSESG